MLANVGSSPWLSVGAVSKGPGPTCSDHALLGNTDTEGWGKAHAMLANIKASLRQLQAWVTVQADDWSNRLHYL